MEGCALAQSAGTKGQKGQRDGRVMGHTGHIGHMRPHAPSQGTPASLGVFAVNTLAIGDEPVESESEANVSAAEEPPLPSN